MLLDLVLEKEAAETEATGHRFLLRQYDDKRQMIALSKDAYVLPQRASFVVGGQPSYQQRHTRGQPDPEHLEGSWHFSEVAGRTDTALDQE